MINENEAAWLDRLLKPVYGPIREAILEAFRYRQTRYAEELSNHTARTRASLQNDLIVVHFLRKKLQSLQIRVFKVNNRFLFDVRGEAILHFKKLNRFLLSSNLQTEFAFKFTRQLTLPGIPLQLPRLVAGYIPNKDWTAIQDIHVTYPVGEKVEWARSLMELKPGTTIRLDQPNENAQRERKRQRRKFRRPGDKSNPNDRTGTDSSEV